MNPKPQILVVEDDAFYQEFLARALGPEYDVDRAASGQKALELMTAKTYDAVLCDLRLPGIAGKELVGRIRAAGDEEIILIVITGFEKDWPPVEATDANVFFYLKKGEFSPRDLKKVVQNGLLLRKSRLERRRFAEELRALNAELERKVAERTRALLESEAKYRNLFEQSMVGVYIEQGGLIRLANQKLSSLLGTRPQDLIGKPLSEFVEPSETEGFTIVPTADENGSRQGPEEVLLRTRSGGQRVALHCSGPIRFQGADAVQGCLLDITAWKELERQLLQHQKMESLATLVSGFAHEFNNILTAILPQAEILKMKAAEHPAIRKPVEILYTMTEKACGLTRQLLGMSRRNHVRKGPVDVNTRIHETLSFLSPTLGSSTQVQLDLDPRAGTIEGDADQIDQILMNLVLNARDAMPEGGTIRISTSLCTSTAVEARTRGSGRDRTFVEILVEDTGHGIAPEHLSRIFDPFFTTKEPGKGTGLGLSVVYNVVKAHGGEIFAKSHPGKGSSFRILLPKPAPETPAQTQEQKSTEKAGRILVADPDPGTLNLFRDVLSRMHYEVIPARDGQEALDIYSRQKEAIDWVIMDGRSQSHAPHSPLHRMVTLNPRVKLIVTHPSAAPGEDQTFDLPLGPEGRIRHLELSHAPEGLSRNLQRVLDLGGC
jgi:PAS domain S-box-containing protein